LITKPSRLPAGVESDPADPVVNRRIVTMRPIEFELVTMRQPRRMILARFFRTDPQRIGGIEIANAVILDEHLRDTIVRRRQQEAVVEPDLQRPRLEFAVPV